MIDATYCTRVEEEHVARVSSLISTAFAGPVKDCEEWVRSQGLGDLRCLVRADGRVDGCLRRIDMGQYFGGRSVPMAGIAGVAVAPESRGAGLARWMMQRALEEMHEQGVALSTLYASTQALYRQVGYEQGGHRVQYSLPLAEIEARERGGSWCAVSQEGVERLEPCYRAYASAFNGTLDRAPYIWKRTFDWRERRAIAYAGLDTAGAVEAYATVAQKRKENGRVSLDLTDLAFRDARGAERLMAMLHDYASMADDVTFHAGPHHPFNMLLGQQRAAGSFREYWMLRLVRLEAALSARGYNPAATAEVHLDVEDRTLPGNAGRFVLRVRDGGAAVERGGRGEVRITERAMASLYTGLSTPRLLATCGGLTGPAGALDQLALVFGGAAPWMPDFF